MRMRNKKGMTAMVDAMIFIVVLGIAVSALFAYSGEEPVSTDATSVSESIFSAKLHICDLTEIDDSGLISMPDAVAFSILTGDKKAIEYIKSILDSLTHRPKAYCLTIDYRGETVKIGETGGDPVSGSTKEYTVTYGGSITVDLKFY
ncbi:MAG: hypothetical protein FWC29_00500 [Methanomassiliicoccaceae archaeon]|nr:hypothetical protein [Methanomassiliicoccaceae archaeon]